MPIDGKHRLLDNYFARVRRERARDVLPFRIYRDFLIRYAAVVHRRNERPRGFLHLGNRHLLSMCRGKKHRDSMPRGEIGRQIDRRVVKPRRLLNPVLTRAPLIPSLFTTFIERCRRERDGVLFHLKIHRYRKKRANLSCCA